MKKNILFILIILFMNSCVDVDDESEILEDLLFSPEYGITAPQNLSAEILNTNAIKLDWNDVINVQYYRIYFSINVPDNFIRINQEYTKSNCEISNLERFRTYYFYVTAVNDYGVESSGSNIINITLN